MKCNYKKENLKNAMAQLSFDITRRCNLNCRWCFKGEAQNQDITKEIVDKTIKEMKNIYIHSIRFFGGEPLLNPDMIEYIIDRLIEERIIFGGINLFTNGTVRNIKIVNSFNKALKYLAQIENKESYTKKIVDSLSTYIPDNLSDHEKQKIKSKKIVMFVSAGDICNSNKDEVNKTLNYYNSKINEGFAAIDIYEKNKHPRPLQIILEGKAEINYSDLIDTNRPLDWRNVRKTLNQYCILNHYIEDPQKRFITKSVSVATDGNVYVGCSLPYKRIEKEAMFKIQNCNNDFFEKVEEWSYNHNVHEKSDYIREKFKTICFCREKNILLKNVTEHDFEVLKLYNEIITAQEKLARDEHILCPHLLTDEVECMAIATICLKLMENGATYETIHKYLDVCTDFGAENIIKSSPEFFRGLILFLSNKNEERKNQKLNLN